MTPDHSLEHRARQILSSRPGFEEKPFLGGIGFFDGGRLIVGVVNDSLCVRVPDESEPIGLDEPGVGPFLFAGRPVAGWLSVEGQPLDDSTLAAWVEVGEKGWRSA